MEGRKVGRPRKGDTVKRAPLNMKTTPRLRDRMQRAADANGRALTQEVEARLDRSLTGTTSSAASMSRPSSTCSA